MYSKGELQSFVRLHLRQRAYDHPARDQDLGVVSLGYEPDAFEAAIRAFGDRYEVEEAARVTYQGTSRPILSVSSPHPEAASTRLLIVSGIHGNERAGIVSIPEILERFDRDGPVAVRVLTPVNAIGAAELSRFNADGYDINRDFVRFRTEEARLVRRTFDDFHPDMVLSLHEGPQEAAFMFANRHVDGGLARRLLAALQAGGTVLAEKDYFGLRLKPPGLSASTPLQRAVVGSWERAFRMRAVNGFAAQRGIPELTLESGWRSEDRAARVRAHVDLVLALQAELTAASRGSATLSGAGGAGSPTPRRTRPARRSARRS
jgi:hypothetical protein